MPVLDNPKHELFAQELAKGKSQVEAYEIAGYVPNDGNATKLAANPEVQERVKEITGRAAVRAELTIEGLISEAAEIQALAVKLEQPSAAVAALTAKAKLAGLWIDKAENTNRNVDADRYSDAELAAIVERDRSAGSPSAQGNPTKLN